MSRQLQNFFREHYVASNMALAVYGPQDISTLEGIVKDYFSSIREVDKADTVYNQPLFDSAN